MEDKVTVCISVGPSFGLFVVLLVLKLCGVISWSWWWITAPLWALSAFLLVILLIALIVAPIKKIIITIYLKLK